MSASNAAADLFLQHSDFWRPPDNDFWQDVASGSMDEAIASLSEQAGYPPLQRDRELFRDLLPPLESLRNFFIRCFIGIGKKSVLPVESLYKKWTEDPTARLPIAGSTGYLMGDAALHARYLLDHYGLSVPPDYQMMPDHLVLLLELAAYLLRQRTETESHMFLKQHLDWLGRFGEALGETETEEESDRQARRFYQLAVQSLQQTVTCHLQQPAGSLQPNEASLNQAF